MKNRPHNFKDRTGEKHITNQGYEIEIIEYFGIKNCTIKFSNGIILYNTFYHHIKSGNISNPYHPSVFGKGFQGVGKYVPTINGNITKEYQYWHSMLVRCYSVKYKERFPSYKDVMLCDEWHCFQDFAKWFEENYNPEYMDSWQLDKDILFKGNKTYSPSTCAIVPSDINYLFLRNKHKRGSNPIGVKLKNKSNKYLVQLMKFGKRVYLGVFDTIDEAFNVYKEGKEHHIKEVADLWKDLIDPRVYEAMYNYEVEIID